MADTTLDILQQSVPSRFQLSRELGSGAMGVVCLAHDNSLARQVAIKFLNLNKVAQTNPGRMDEIRTRFNREARISGRINHPNIVRVYEAYLDEEFPFFVMEYLDGITLNDRKRQEPRLTAIEACHIVRRIASALSYALASFNMIHRDLKPANIMITRTGDVKVVDLGLAKITVGDDGPALTQAGAMVGTPYYMAPEQIQGKPNLDHTIDIYALGIILYELIARNRAFTGNTKKEMYQAKWHKKVAPLNSFAPSVPPSLVELVERMLEPQFGERLSSYAEIDSVLADAINQLQRGVTGDSRFESGVTLIVPAGGPPEEILSGLDDETTTLDEIPESRLKPGAADHGTSADGKTPSVNAAPEPSPYQDFLPTSQAILANVEPGMQFGQYEIIRQIGIGGMGIVYQARNVSNGADTAVKVLIQRDEADDAATIEEFRREADVIRHMEHDAIVKVLDIGHDRGLNYFAMDLFLGPDNTPMSLLDYARLYDGRLDPESLQGIMIHLLDAIGYAHQRNVVHCDIKPANVLFRYVGDEEGEGETFWTVDLKLTDFGLAKVIGEDLVLESVKKSIQYQQSGSVLAADADALIGTYEFMSPEQRRGETASQQSDLFAIGLILFRLLTGQRELGLKRPSEIRSDIDRKWDRVIFTALEDDAQNRFSTAQEMAAAISEIVV